MSADVGVTRGTLAGSDLSLPGTEMKTVFSLLIGQRSTKTLTEQLHFTVIPFYPAIALSDDLLQFLIPSFD